MSDNASFAARMRARFAANWRRIRRTIRNYSLLVFLLAILAFGAFFNRIVNFVVAG